MKERPILFSAPMVRALLDGSKTQTRRIFCPERMRVAQANNGTLVYDTYAKRKGEIVHTGGGPFRPEDWLHYCPYGQPGDRLWVRESFQPLFAEGIEWRYANWKTGEGYATSYPATDGIQEFMDADDNLSDRCWPSIHMPRWASRILLEIVAVRVERLQDISEADCYAEGIRIPCDENYMPLIDISSKFSPSKYLQNPRSPSMDDLARAHYFSLWESLNGAGSWQLNPWVWVVEFRRIKP